MNNLIFFDGHNDSLVADFLPSINKGRDFFKENSTGHIDLPRMKRGNFRGGFFAIWIPNDKEKPGNDISQKIKTEDGYEFPMAERLDLGFSINFTKEILSFAKELEYKSNGEIKIVESYSDIVSSIEKNKIAMLLHLEGAEAVEESLSNLQELYDLGVRSIGPVWSRHNKFGYGVPFKFPTSPDIGAGLTDAGKDLVRGCNDIGIMIDMSHLNEKGFWDVLKISKFPLVVSHSASNAITPTARNLTDDQLIAISDSGGLVGLNFCVTDIRKDADNNAETPLSDYLDHLNHLVNKMGIEHVALGSDFGGAKISNEIKDVAGLPKLAQFFANNGYDDDMLEKICYKNWLRVLRDTIK